jgi:hypothetical protein
MEVHIDEIYLRFKNILSGCRTIYDALYFAKYIISKYPESVKLINGMIHNKSYDKILDYRTIINTLKILDKFDSRQEINDYIEKNIKNDYDYVQLNALMRVGFNKKILKDNDYKDKIYTINNNTTIKNINNKNNVKNNIENIDNINDMNDDNINDMNDMNDDNINDVNIDNINDMNDMNDMNDDNINDVNIDNINDMNDMNDDNINDVNIDNINDTNDDNINDVNIDNINFDSSDTDSEDNNINIIDFISDDE